MIPSNNNNNSFVTSTSVGGLVVRRTTDQPVVLVVIGKGLLLLVLVLLLSTTASFMVAHAAIVDTNDTDVNNDNDHNVTNPLFMMDGASTTTQFRSTRIVGGVPAKDGAYPSFGISAGDSLCGGTLIHSDIFLSAAHCVGVFKDNGIYIGGNLRNGYDSQYYEVDYEILYPNNDIDLMIVKLSTQSTNPIQKLYFEEQTTATPPTYPTSSIGPNEIVIAIGFGTTVFSGDYPDILMEVYTSTIDSKYCIASYPGTYQSESMICAGSLEGGEDSCHGDSGGPLLLVDGTQIGITSWGLGCGIKGFPGVYTKITNYEDYIKNMICGYSDNISTIDYCTNRPRLSKPCKCHRTQYLCRFFYRCLFIFP